jgi:bacterioferritin
MNAGTKKMVDALNEALEHELGAIIRYLHHSFLVMGPNRAPLVAFLRARAKDSVDHAVQLGEKVTALGGHPTVKIAEHMEPGRQSVEEILREELEAEKKSFEVYVKRLPLFKNNLPLEFMMQQFIIEENEHIESLEKLLRKE